MQLICGAERHLPHLLNQHKLLLLRFAGHNLRLRLPLGLACVWPKLKLSSTTCWYCCLLEREHERPPRESSPIVDASLLLLSTAAVFTGRLVRRRKQQIEERTMRSRSTTRFHTWARDVREQITRVPVAAESDNVFTRDTDNHHGVIGALKAVEYYLRNAIGLLSSLRSLLCFSLSSQFSDTRSTSLTLKYKIYASSQPPQISPIIVHSGMVQYKQINLNS